MVRVTTSMYYKNMYAQNSKVQHQLFDVNKQISSGHQIQYAFENTDTFIKTMRLDNEITTLEQVKEALEAGADLIFNTCSSVGDVALEAQKELDIPLVKIDDAMAREAVAKGSVIGVLATLSTTLDPTIRLLMHFAREAGKEVQVKRGLAEGAFQAVISGDRKTHDDLILKAAMKLAPGVDLFVLAQGSMARMEKQLAESTGKSVLSSPEKGVLHVKQVLESLPA